jgi:hypothetical protein
LRGDCQIFDRVPLKGDQEKSLIYRLQWDTAGNLNRATLVMPIHEVTQYVDKFQLRLKVQGREILLLPQQTPFHIGRDPNKAQLLIETELASREHCHIEFRRGKYVLIDHSTNGTYVSGNEQDSIYLRREELPLHGYGVISLGQPTSGENSWLIYYQL